MSEESKKETVTKKLEDYAVSGLYTSVISVAELYEGVFGSRNYEASLICIGKRFSKESQLYQSMRKFAKSLEEKKVNSENREILLEISIFL